VDLDSESNESIDESIKGVEQPPPAPVGETSEVGAVVEASKVAPTVEPVSRAGNGVVEGVVKPDDTAPAATASNGDGPKKGVEVKPTTKHVKRSSFFGGIFG
jgi:hypothetical protein